MTRAGPLKRDASWLHLPLLSFRSTFTPFLVLRPACATSPSDITTTSSGRDTSPHDITMNPRQRPGFSPSSDEVPISVDYDDLWSVTVFTLFVSLTSRNRESLVSQLTGVESELNGGRQRSQRASSFSHSGRGTGGPPYQHTSGRSRARSASRSGSVQSTGPSGSFGGAVSRPGPHLHPHSYNTGMNPSLASDYAAIPVHVAEDCRSVNEPFASIYPCG